MKKGRGNDDRVISKNFFNRDYLTEAARLRTVAVIFLLNTWYGFSLPAASMCAQAGNVWTFRFQRKSKNMNRLPRMEQVSFLFVRFRFSPMVSRVKKKLIDFVLICLSSSVYVVQEGPSKGSRRNSNRDFLRILDKI